MKNESLVRIIELSRDGNADAFARLLKLYGPKLYRYFVRSVGSAETAEDMLQDLFVKLLVKIRDYHHEGRFESWLFRIAANMVRDYYRSSRRSPSAVSLSDRDDETAAIPQELASCQPSPPELMETDEQLDLLRKALLQLSPSDRRIILLRHYGGLSFKELAQHYQVPIGTALARVHRGLKKLNRLIIKNENV